MAFSLRQLAKGRDDILNEAQDVVACGVRFLADTFLFIKPALPETASLPRLPLHIRVA